MNVGVTIVRGRAPGARTVRTIAARMLRSLDLEDAELSVVLCDDAFIRDLNSRFAGENHATDVLAFALSEGPGPRTRSRPLGDIVISLETAGRQASARGSTLLDEVLVLLAHGLLHLLGWDHRDAAEERAMSAKTAELVRAADVVRDRPRRSAARRARSRRQAR